MEVAKADPIVSEEVKVDPEQQVIIKDGCVIRVKPPPPRSDNFGIRGRGGRGRGGPPRGGGRGRGFGQV